MKIVFFGNATEKIAAIRYRILTFAEMLEVEGHRCVICLPSSVALSERLYENRSKLSKLLYFLLVFLRRIGQLRHVLGADVVYFRGPVFLYGPPFFERIIRLLNSRMVFDIDDAIWEPPAHVTSRFRGLIDYGWVGKMCGMCAHAVVGNAYLADHVRPRNPNITIIPTCIDMEKHRAKTYDEDPQRAMVLGWTGLKDNLGYMDIIKDVLRDLARKYNLKLCVATGCEYHLEDVEVENHYWTIEDEFDYLSEPDIGLMPLKETLRARGKCAFKALQYMGVCTPAVISPVGMNADVIEDGVTGFLAESPEEWREKLERLITDPALRRSMGEAARKVVEAKYSHTANYPKLRAVIETVGGMRKGG